MNNAFKFLKKNDNVLQANYPYTATDAKCDSNAKKQSNSKLTKFEDVREDKEGYDSLIDALQLQPIAVAVQANQAVFLDYDGGVIDGNLCVGTRLDHGVLLVGLENDAQLGDVFVVRNSWGSRWGGNGGYLKISA